MKAFLANQTKGHVHCPMCTHTVPAEIEVKGKVVRTAPGQTCPRCGSSLDVAVVVQIPEAA
jgi:transposase-like protein